jgi:DNA topoisomerase I
MAEALVIVESPAKAKTINKYLGSRFKVLSSKGHVRDLPRSWNPQSFEDASKPPYVVLDDREALIKEITDQAELADRIIIATDPDREGEAIGWHLSEVLREHGLTKPVVRVRFNEITKAAVNEALLHPTEIDQKRVDAQQARRVIDRVMGYGLSQLLWKKILRGLSGGRVQSVALKLICEREDEIDAFIPDEYWIVGALLEGKEPPPFTARLKRCEGEKCEPKTGEHVERIRQALNDARWIVTGLEVKERKRSPPPPYTTSKFQQDASRRGMAVRRAMQIAQGLYEGKEVAGRGLVGLITYMRTDSVRVSDAAITAVRDYVSTKIGPEYLPEKPNFYKSKGDAQDAHEAIRPTFMDLPPQALRGDVNADDLRVYTWIWNRFVASQMKPALFDETIVTVTAANHDFESKGEVQKFAGYLRVYQDSKAVDETDEADEDPKEGKLPRVAKGDVLTLRELQTEQKFTQPPPRYTEATLVKALEENGIGRPSTYAEILSKLGVREYTVLEANKFRPTRLGREVTRRLVPHFVDIIDTEYTRKLEEQLDEVEDQGRNWRDLLREFEGKFRSDLGEALEKMEGILGGIVLDPVMPCEKCAAPMKLRFSRNGEFLSCSRYPDCDYKKDLASGGEVPTFEEPCPYCGKTMVFRTGRFGEYLACPDNPKTCKGKASLRKNRDGTWKILRVKPLDRNCPRCGSQLLERENARGSFVACSGYPNCEFIEQESTGIACPKGDGDLVVKPTRRGKPFYGCSSYPSCNFVAFDKPLPEPCPHCGAAFTLEKETKKHGTFRYCHREECSWTNAPEGAPKPKKPKPMAPRPKRVPAGRRGRPAPKPKANPKPKDAPRRKAAAAPKAT